MLPRSRFRGFRQRYGGVPTPAAVKVSIAQTDGGSARSIIVRIFNVLVIPMQTPSWVDGEGSPPPGPRGWCLPAVILISTVSAISMFLVVLAIKNISISLIFFNAE